MLHMTAGNLKINRIISGDNIILTPAAISRQGFVQPVRGAYFDGRRTMDECRVGAKVKTTTKEDLNTNAFLGFCRSLNTHTHTHSCAYVGARKEAQKDVRLSKSLARGLRRLRCISVCVCV